MMWFYTLLSWITTLPKCDICGEARDIVRIDECSGGGILYCEKCAMKEEE